ncbi:YggN family protein [Rheinheimera sp. 4Y26]|uniref:YggN family protein n=1 Tax=Rheinheimera sp. 4Y26 TaxID=2977811 RepID=UPI0021B0AC7B|nr:YggN family protein [Rheinheimera sp. 4Y26]MCT6698008.1 YggN family protein [Rheinheimera sp. 4Y26]
MKTLIATAIAASLSFSAFATDSQNCALQFKDDLVINPTSVQLQRADQSLWLINSEGQLFLDGKAVSTDANTQLALQQYQQGLRGQAQETALLVADALQMASEAISRVVTQFGGDNSDVQLGIDKSLAKLRGNIDQLVIKNGDEIRINGSKLHNADAEFSKEFEQAIESSMTEMTGSMLVMVGQAMSRGEGNFEQRMEQFGQEMEKFGQELEADMESRGAELEKRGNSICQNLQQLDQLEQQIQQQVPAMTAFDLINTSEKGLQLSFKSADGQTE